MATQVSRVRNQGAPYSPLMLPPGSIAGSNGFLCLRPHFAGSSWNKKQKCWPLMQEPVAMLFTASQRSGSAKNLTKKKKKSLHLPGQFRVSRGPDSLDNLQSSVTIYGSLSKANSESSHSPISNRNTSENKVCCQVPATSSEVGGQAAWWWGRVSRRWTFGARAWRAGVVQSPWCPNMSKRVAAEGNGA